MTDIEIFSKALKKARENLYCGVLMSNEQAYEHRYEILFGIGSDVRFCFAQAFWGEKQVSYKYNTTGAIPKLDLDDTIPAWQYHLQQIVLEKNPIKYLEKFL